MQSLGILGLLACGTPWEEDTQGMLRRLVVTEDASRSGTLQVRAQPLPGETSMQWVIQADEPDGQERVTHVRSLERGRDLVYRASEEVDPSNPFARSGAAFVASTTTMNWPISADDGPLGEQRYTLRAGIADASRAYVEGTASIQVLFKSDADPAQGTLPVNLVFGGTTEDDPDVTSAVDEAVLVWRDVYRNIGIELDIERLTIPEGALTAPGQGDAAAYEQLTGSFRPGAVNLFVLEEIRDFGGALGFAGGIPGPIVPSDLSGVVVNTTLSAGTNGLYEPAEVVLLGETMAHEVGHYLGLFHPVEATFDSWDALDDTPTCDDQDDCLEDLGENLMFPFPVCSGPVCVQQQVLSPEQIDVAHRYTGVQ